MERMVQGAGFQSYTIDVSASCGYSFETLSIHTEIVSRGYRRVGKLVRH